MKPAHGIRLVLAGALCVCSVGTQASMITLGSNGLASPVEVRSPLDDGRSPADASQPTADVLPSTGSPQVVAEPATLLLLGTGLLGAAAIRRRLMRRT